MDAVSPARVIERVRLAQQSPIQPEETLRDCDPDLQDEVEAAIESGRTGLAQQLLIAALGANPHLIDAQLMLIDATPSLSEFDRAKLFEELLKTYWLVVSRSCSERSWSSSEAFARTAIIVASRLAAYYDSVGQVQEALSKRWQALQKDDRDGWGNRYHIAGYLLLLGDPRREHWLYRRCVGPVARIPGRVHYHPEMDPFWIVFDLVRAVIRRDDRAEQIYQFAQQYPHALAALVAGERPDIDPDGPHTMKDKETRIAYFLWPAVHVHAHARRWLRERLGLATR